MEEEGQEGRKDDKIKSSCFERPPDSVLYNFSYKRDEKKVVIMFQAP